MDYPCSICGKPFPKFVLVKCKAANKVFCPDCHQMWHATYTLVLIYPVYEVPGIVQTHSLIWVQ